MKAMKLGVVVLMVTLSACTQKNPNLCCIDAADCEAVGISMSDGACADGLVCRGNQCIAETCSTSAQCDSSAPYCGGSGLCVAACEMDSECPGFGGTAAEQYCQMGACVECRTDADCGTDKPVCDGGTCRGCAIDTDCDSGACDESNGSCVDESSIVYAAPAGTDSGTCPMTAPCKTLQFAVTATLANRSHIVLAPGSYPDTQATIDATKTLAPSVYIHGHGATIVTAAGESNWISVVNVAATIQDLLINENSGGSFGHPIACQNAPCVIRRVKIRGNGRFDGIYVGQNVTLQDVDISNSRVGVIFDDSSHLVADRVAIHGGQDGLISNDADAIVNITNMEIFDMTRTSINLSHVSGTIQYSTFSHSIASSIVSNNATLPPAMLHCVSGLTIQSSVLWNPSPDSVVYGPCAISNSIVGPSYNAVYQGGGTMTTNMSTDDPKFKNEDGRDFHLTAASPAVDKLDSGPVTDFDGTPRPQGPKFDYGAFEFKP